MTMEAAVPAPEAVSISEPGSAGFWVRGGALSIDLLILAALGGLSSAVAGHLGAPIWVIFGVSFVVGGAYQTLMVGRWAQTVGKMAAGVQIVRPDGSRVGYGRAFARFLAIYVSAIPLDIGFLIAAFTPRKRGLHDYIADTRVVYETGVGRWRQAAMVTICVLSQLAAIGFGIYVGIKTVSVQRASIDRARGDYSAAADADGGMIRLMPKSAVGWNNRCWDRALAGELDGALEDCDEALRLGRIPAALDSRGMVLLKMKRFDEAIASYSEALSQNPRLSDSLYGRGIARADKGDLSGAEADIQAALKIDPRVAQSYRKYGVEPLTPIQARP